MAQEWWLVRPVTPVLRGLAGSIARGRLRVHPPLPRGVVGFPLPSRRAAART